MVIEAGVVAGYVTAWAVRKARRVGDRLDDEADEVIDASMDRLHEVVAAKLSGHPVLAEIVKEAETVGGGVSGATRQELVLAITRAAAEDDAFGQAVTELAVRLREQGAGTPVIGGSGSVMFTGDAKVRAESGGIAIGQVAGAVHVSQGPAGPTRPGRPSR